MRAALVCFISICVACGQMRLIGQTNQSDAAIWYSHDGVRWIRERRENATYDFNDPGAQAIRALVRYGAGGVAVYAFGVDGIGQTGEPRLWRGTLG